MKNTTLRLILIILISASIGYYFGINKVALDWKNYKPSLSIVNKKPPPQTTVDFSLFWNVWEKLEENFYDKSKLDPQQMVNGGISGMVQSLGDPYTIYLPPQQNSNFKQGLAGQFSGIGAELGMRDKQVVVIAPLDGSPAYKAGVRPADAIIKVDGVSTLGWSLSQAVEKIRGEKGTEVILTVIHKDSKKSEDLKIIRDIITVKSVEGWIKTIREIESIKSTKGIKGKENDRVAYIRLSQFGDQTNKEWVSLVNTLSLQIQGDKSVKGLILDLRNNPGGYLTDAVFIASEFLGVGKTVVLEDNGRDNKTAVSAARKGLFLNIPLVILINKGSASASEIVAAAMRDNNRAILVGETSFGKGSIQMANDLGNGAGLHITIAKWLTPKGVWVNGKGLKPDVEVKPDDKNAPVGEASKSRDVQLERAVEELIK
jgi:carboxyl-terminal processing protease